MGGHKEDQTLGFSKTIEASVSTLFENLSVVEGFGLYASALNGNVFADCALPVTMRRW